jgi:CcmD family protein
MAMRRLRRAATTVFVFGALWLAPGGSDLATPSVAAAQDASEERSQSFKAVEGAVKEDVPGGPLLVAAYGAIWVLVLGYLFRIVLLQQRSAAELQRLEQALAQRRPGEPRAG